MGGLRSKWYLTDHGIRSSADPEFGHAFAWDLETLSGYPHRFLRTAHNATPSSFWKCRLRESLAERLQTSGARALWIQGWQVAAYWQAVYAAKSAGVEVWLRGESNDLAPTPIWKRGPKRLILGQLFARVDRFLYIGTANRRLYQKFGVPGGRLHPAPYAVDNERFAKQAEALREHRAELRRAWRIPADAFCVLFCGKFIDKKRPLDLVEAVRRLKATGRANPHLLFVGSGALGAQLRDGCRVVFDADAPDFSPPSPVSDAPSASFAGFLNQTEISRAYVAADCLALPSDYGETWGLVANEAMASGVPCVISDHCGCAEDLGTSPGNLIFPCGHRKALAEALLTASDRRQSGEAPPGVCRPPSIVTTVQTVSSCYASIAGAV